MDPLSLAAFEERAATAEARLAVLEAKAATGSVSNPAALQQVRALVVAAKEQTLQLQQERDQAVADKKSLEDELLRLKYQVMHLKRAVREGDQKLSAANA